MLWLRLLWAGAFLASNNVVAVAAGRSDLFREKKLKQLGRSGRERNKDEDVDRCCAVPLPADVGLSWFFVAWFWISSLESTMPGPLLLTANLAK